MYYRRAADQGHAPARHNLESLYSFGQATGINKTEAVKYDRLPADRGVVADRLSLAYRVEQGEIKSEKELVE